MSEDDPQPREAAAGRRAYADLVAALLGQRPDPTSDRFDAELDRAVQSGRLDAATARTLRWWQRRSVQAALDYAEEVIPDALASRDDATARARNDVSEAAASWGRATERPRSTGDDRRRALRRTIVVDLKAATPAPAPRHREHHLDSPTTVTVDQMEPLP